MPNDFIRLPADSTGKTVRTFRLASGEHIEAVRDAPVSPKFSTLFSANLVPSGSVSLTTSSVSVSKVGKLSAVSIGSSVPIKAEIRRVVSTVPTTVDVAFTSGFEPSKVWTPPHRDFLTVVAGDQFQVRITNLDPSATADVYATVYYDEDDI